MMHACGELPEVSIECGSVLTIRELLLETDMLTLLSRDQLRVEIEAGLHLTLPLLLAIERTIGITTRRDWRPTAPQRDMIAILHAVAQALSSKFIDRPCYSLAWL